MGKSLRRANSQEAPLAHYLQDVPGRVLEEESGITIAYEVLASYPKGKVRAVTVRYRRGEGYYLAIIATSGMTVWSNKLPFGDNFWWAALADLRDALAEHDCPQFEIVDPRSAKP
jgi:hypothetical protein